MRFLRGVAWNAQVYFTGAEERFLFLGQVWQILLEIEALSSDMVTGHV